MPDIIATTPAQELISSALVWDAHAGFAFETAENLAELARWREAGISFVSVNVCYDVQPWTTAVEALSKYRHWLRAHEDFVQVETINDVSRAKREGKLAVSFDLEGANALNEDPGMVDLYYRLGVRQMLFAYNRNNAVAGGCHDTDTGLTALGRAVLKEMNRVGMLVDCSHCAYRTTLEVMDASEAPVIFSHSNARRLCDHERNIWDDQIQRCAARDGLVGVTGVGLFLGPNGADPAHVVEHIDHICQLVGPRHVGLGLDSVLLRNSESVLDLSAMGEVALKFWPARQYPAGPIGFVPPEALPAIVEGLLARGYGADDVRAVLGGNFIRLAAEVWKPFGGLVGEGSLPTPGKPR